MFATRYFPPRYFPDVYFPLGVGEDPCPIAYDPAGRAGIAVAQSPSGTDYPLVDPSDDIKYLVADLFLGYDDPSDYGESEEAFTPPFAIAQLRGFGCSGGDGGSSSSGGGVRIVIADAEDRTVFDSDDTPENLPNIGYTERAWGTRLHIHEWHRRDAICRLVVHTKWPTGGEAPSPQEYADVIYPDSAQIDVRAVTRWPKRLRSVRVGDTVIDSGRLELVGGYNMQFETVVRTGRRPASQILISATPGAGLGVVEDCPPPELLLRAINGVGPTSSGHFTFSAKDCYSWRQPATGTIPNRGELDFGNDCSPCLDCAEVVETAQMMNDLRNCFKNLGLLYSQIRDKYHEARARWVQYQENCATHQGGGLRGVITPGACPFADVTLQYTNRGTDCVTDVVVHATMTAAPAGTATVVSGLTFQSGGQPVPGRARAAGSPYAVEGTWPTFTAYWDRVQPGETVHTRFRLNFSNCGVSGNTPYVVGGTLSGSTSAGALSAATMTAVALRCPPATGSGATNNPCGEGA